MKLKVTDINNKAHGEIEHRRRRVQRHLRPPRCASDILARAGELAAGQAPVRQPQDQGDRRHLRHHQEAVRRRRAPATPARVRCARRSSAAARPIFGPVVRSHAHDLPKKVRKLALKTALSAKHEGRQADRLGRAPIAGGKTKDAGEAVRQARAGPRCWSIDGPAVEHEVRAGRAQHPERGCAAAAGRQRVRHPAPRHPGPDQGRGATSGGAPEMSRARTMKKPKVNLAEAADARRSSAVPVVTEKSTMGSSTTRSPSRCRSMPPSRRSRLRSRACSR